MTDSKKRNRSEQIKSLKIDLPNDDNERRIVEITTVKAGPQKEGKRQRTDNVKTINIKPKNGTEQQPMTIVKYVKPEPESQRIPIQAHLSLGESCMLIKDHNSAKDPRTALLVFVNYIILTDMFHRRCLVSAFNDRAQHINIEFLVYTDTISKDKRLLNTQTIIHDEIRDVTSSVFRARDSQNVRILEYNRDNSDAFNLIKDEMKLLVQEVIGFANMTYSYSTEIDHNANRTEVTHYHKLTLELSKNYC